MSFSTNRSIPMVPEDHAFLNPVKLVKTIDDMQKWDTSEAYFEYLGFLFTINDAIRGKNNSEGSINASEPIKQLAELLSTLMKWVDEIPPIQQPQRFGNTAFKTWYNRLKDAVLELLESIFPEDLYRSIPEIMVYLVESFGNPIRIDYGTGHEISFLMFLCALYKIGYLKESDYAATACLVFDRYLVLVRKLQQTYRMEPAGSHGVWSLDDYQFVPFIWGSSQLIGNPQLEPSSFVKPEIANNHAAEYMFMSCIKYINQVKTGPFGEHSNQLWNMSGVSSWSKINAGLIKMYKVEVLSKFPVVQHIVFGSLFTMKPAKSGDSIRRPVRPEDTQFKRPSVKISKQDESSSTSGKE